MFKINMTHSELAHSQARFHIILQTQILDGTHIHTTRSKYALIRTIHISEITGIYSSPHARWCSRRYTPRLCCAFYYTQYPRLTSFHTYTQCLPLCVCVYARAIVHALSYLTIMYRGALSDCSLSTHTLTHTQSRTDNQRTHLRLCWVARQVVAGGYVAVRTPTHSSFRLSGERTGF